LYKTKNVYWSPHSNSWKYNNHKDVKFTGSESEPESEEEDPQELEEETQEIQATSLMVKRKFPSS
jgi:hypothetical protein